MHILRTRPVMALTAAILAVLLLTGIAYAVGRWTGFIPGIGFVQDAHAILETPVTVQREMIVTPTSAAASTQTPTPAAGNGAQPGDGQNALPVAQEKKGITITVEQVAAEPAQLVIFYKITGLPPNIFGPERSEKLSAEQSAEDPFMVDVRIPDGSLLELGSGGNCRGGGDLSTSWLSCRLVRLPLPEGVSQLTLEIHRLPNSLPGELPEDWVIPISLSPVSASQSEGSLQEPNLSSGPVNGITLRLVKVDQSPARTAFQLAMEWEGANRFVQYTAPITLQDAQSRYYVLSGGPDGGAYTIENPNHTTLPSQVTSAVDGSSPLTFRMDWVFVSASTRRDSANGGATLLKFDPGAAARVGQEWAIDQAFQAGEFNLHFTKARLKAAQDGTFVLEFDIQAPPAVTRVNLFPKEGHSLTTESGYDKARGVLVSRVMLPALPAQPVELYVAEVVYKVDGPWEITWQPQRLDIAFPTPTPAPTRLAPPADAFTPGEPLLAEAQALLNKAPLPTGPGWVHGVIQIDQAAPIGILDSGDQPERPLQTIFETWQLLDEQGFIRTSVSIQKTPDGKLISAEINHGVYYFSFPEGRGNVSEDIYLAEFSYYDAPLVVMDSYVTEGGKVSREDGTVEGKACRRYTATRPYDPPMVFWGEPAPVTTMAYSVCIDPLSGAVLQTQVRMGYSDGTSRVNETTRFISLEKVATPPDEVRRLLESVVMP